mmetsp:Transcript_18043/g.38800  ORF Transcript_18043/g.38800 Transcript_18043/m.38800 type:complete len:241 (+) Transcript_18043:1300-2022(+)
MARCQQHLQHQLDLLPVLLLLLLRSVAGGLLHCIFRPLAIRPCQQPSLLLVLLLLLLLLLRRLLIVLLGCQQPCINLSLALPQPGGVRLNGRQVVCLPCMQVVRTLPQLPLHLGWGHHELRRLNHAVGAPHCRPCSRLKRPGLSQCLAGRSRRLARPQRRVGRSRHAHGQLLCGNTHVVLKLLRTPPRRLHHHAHHALHQVIHVLDTRVTPSQPHRNRARAQGRRQGAHGPKHDIHPRRL